VGDVLDFVRAGVLGSTTVSIANGGERAVEPTGGDGGARLDDANVGLDEKLLGSGANQP
jgi:hypothetical protein